MNRLASIVLVVSTVLAASLPAQIGAGDRYSGSQHATRSPVLARRGMACTSQPLATSAAIEILQEGGSAVDAAIAANAVLAVTEPTGCGLGGDMFAILWDPEKKEVVGYNGSGRSPKGLDLEGLKKALDGAETIPLWGPLPVSVPGAVEGWCALHERYGKLPLERVLAPAIHHAREGFPVSQLIARYWRSNARRILSDSSGDYEKENFAATFLVEGEAPREGEIFANPDLARTLAAVAEGGREAFYEGEIARTIDAYSRRVGCHLRLEDLKSHRGEWVDPIFADYRGVRVFELPPNGQGLAALQMLAILEGFDLTALGHNSADYLHLQAEAKKLAFADRARYHADPAFAELPVAELLSERYIAERRQRITMEKAAQDDPPGDPRLEEGDTVFLTTADSSGMMVSWIQSNYVGMGSGLVPDGLGFVLQDRGALFHLDPKHPNAYAPGKRPFHTIIPAFATREGRPWLAFGVMGGAMQPQGHVQIVCNLVDFGMNVQEAGDAARYRHAGSSQPTGEAMKSGGTLALESGIARAVVEALQKRGHRVVRGGSFGGYQAILRDPETGVYRGASEMRKDGHAAGY